MQAQVQQEGVPLSQESREVSVISAPWLKVSVVALLWPCGWWQVHEYTPDDVSHPALLYASMRAVLLYGPVAYTRLKINSLRMDLLKTPSNA